MYGTLIRIHDNVPPIVSEGIPIQLLLRNFSWLLLNRYHVCFQVIMRSGQPLTGTNGRRCKEDEKLINATLRAGKRGYLIDTRSLNVAQQARAKGGGFEQEAHYPQWRRIHKSIER